MAASAAPPLVIQALVPLMMYFPFFKTAFVARAAALEPACGSGRAKQPIFSPRAEDPRNLFYHNGIANVIHTCATLSFGNGHARQSEFGGLLKEFAREFTFLIVFTGEGL